MITIAFGAVHRFLLDEVVNMWGSVIAADGDWSLYQPETTVFSALN